MQEIDSFFVSISIIFCLLTISVAISLYKLTTTKKKTIKELISWNILVSIWVIFVFFFIGEIYVRFLTDQTDAFAINKSTQRWMQRHYQLNNFGTRDISDYQMKMGNKSGRLTFLGDSFVAGHGIKKVQDRFTNIIQGKLPTWEVHTMARNGYETIDILPRVKNLARQTYEFDVVVLVYTLNDISYLAKGRKEVYDRIAELQTSSNWLISNSYLFNALWTRWQVSSDPRISNYYQFVKETYEDPISWEKHCDVIRQLSTFLQTNSRQLLAITFPFLSDLDPNHEFQHVHQKLDTLWQSLHVPHLDLGPVFYHLNEKEMVVNKYDPHPNEKAHRIAAEAIFDFISNSLRPDEFKARH